MEEQKEIYFQCECYGEMLFVEKHKAYGLDEHQYWFSLYGLGNYTASLKNRIKWAWQVLRSGKLWTDQITLNEQNTTRLRDFLIENTK